MERSIKVFTNFKRVLVVGPDAKKMNGKKLKKSRKGPFEKINTPVDIALKDLQIQLKDH